MAFRVPATPGGREGPQGGGPGPGRARSTDHRAPDGPGQAAASCEPPGDRQLPAPSDDISRAVPGGVVHVRHRRSSGEAQYFRFPGPRSAHRDAAAFVGARGQARPGPETRPFSHSAEPHARRTAPQEPYVLEHSGRVRRGLDDPARTRHIPAGTVRGTSALGHVRSGSSRDTGKLFAIHHARRTGPL